MVFFDILTTTRSTDIRVRRAGSQLKSDHNNGNGKITVKQWKYGKTLKIMNRFCCPVQISQIRNGKSTLSWPFSVTNLGNPDRVWSSQALNMFDLDQSATICDGEKNKT